MFKKSLKAGRHLFLIAVWESKKVVCVWVFEFTLIVFVWLVQTPYSIIDELLPAHDKSPPVCRISVVIHVGARPDPTASAPSPTTWGPAWMTDWWENLTWQKHPWLITGAHLSARGGTACQGAQTQKGALYWARPPDSLRLIPSWTNLCGHHGCHG